ncbi:B30.2/SPRY domain-containing protein [Entamoeba marina]
MKVALHLTTYEELMTFIQVSKTCKHSIKALKINPHFVNQESIFLFFKHFNPETVHCYFAEFYSKDVFTKAKCLKTPDFSSNLDKEDEIIGYLDKITHLDLSLSTMSNKESGLDFFVKNAKKFTHLRSVEGDIKYVVKFFKKFTSKGKHKQINFPKRIIINSSNGYAIVFNNTTYNLIVELKKYLPDLNLIYVALVVYSHPSSFTEEIRRELLGINYYYRILDAEQSTISENCFRSFNGDVYMDYFIDGTRFNDLIEKGCGMKCIMRYIRNKKTTDNWVVPSCLKTFEIKDSSLPETFWMNSIDIEFPVDFNQIQQLTISNCSDMLINLSKHITTLIIDKSDYIGININEAYLNNLFIENCSHVNMCGSTTCINNLQIIQSYSCIIPFMSFENKNVIIEDCNTLNFTTKPIPINENMLNSSEGSEETNEEENDDGDNDKEGVKKKNNKEILRSPLDFMNISIDDFKFLSADCLRYPPEEDYGTTLKNKELFRMRKFKTKSNDIKMEGNTLKRVSKKVSTDLLISSNFCNSNDDKKYHHPTLSSTLIPASIRYFEIEVNTFCIISFGIIETKLYQYPADSHVGWRDFSVGFHSDDGTVFNGRNPAIHYYGKAYGSKVNERNVAGCGYNQLTQKVFFTVNGIKYEEIDCNWDYISAALAVDEFDSININYGDSPFVFNIQKEIEKTLTN